MSDMKLLAEAKALLSHHPFTLADAQGPGRPWEEAAVGRRALHRRVVGGSWPWSQADEEARGNSSVGRIDALFESLE